MNNFTKGIRAVILVLLAVPSVAFAYIPLIPTWTDPAVSASYSFTDHIVANGTWQLPPGWIGQIFVYGDGIEKTNVSTGNSYLLLPSNVGNLATSTGSFSFDIGAQTDGSHEIYVRFEGGSECAVNSAFIEAGGALPPGSPTCEKTDSNYAPLWVLPTRTYTVGVPLFPRMVITPDTDPALNFSNVVFGTPQTRSFFISNTGAQTLTGSISGLSAPFSCSPCGYTLNPGDAPTPINITFMAATSPSSFSQNINFSCIGSSLGCEGGSFVTVYQSRHIIGNSVDSGIAPQITLSTSLINYGTVNLGVAIPDRVVTVTNTGGGILNGEVTFNSGEYTCIGSCTYSIPAGASRTILIRYVPVVSGAYSYVASFTGGTGKIVTLQSVVNDQPIVQTRSSFDGTTYFSSGGTINFGTSINVGECRTKDEFIRNNGAGLLSGSVDIPVQPDLTIITPGFSCYLGCTYTNIPHDNLWYKISLRFCPVDEDPVSTLVSFSNTSNPPGDGSTTLTGQGNIAPIGTPSTLSLNFGPVLVSGSKMLVMTVTNTGLGMLSGSVGALPAGYTCSPCTYSLSAGASIPLSFTLSPVAAVFYNGSVILSDVGTLTLTGSGVAPVFKMSYSGDPLSTCPGVTCLPPSPGDYDVGVTTFGGALSVQNKTFYLYVRNMGSGGSVSYDFPDTAHFFCMNPAMCTKTIAPGNGYVIPYEFRPDAATDFTEPLVVTYNYGFGPETVTLNLTGHSVSAPYLSVSPNANISLGDIAVGSAATATFMVTNLGVGALNGSVGFPGLFGTAPTAGLVSHWTFDDADINWTTHQVSDASGAGNTAWLPGPISAVGKVNEALNFTGRGGVRVASVSGLAPGNTVHTMAAWIKVNALPSSRAWIALLGNSAAGAHMWAINSLGATTFGTWGPFTGAGNVQPTLPVGTWVHVATTFDGVTLRSYVNGALSESVSARFNFAGVPLSLGLVPSLFPDESDFNGVLDDVRMYNRALTDADIAQIYSGTYPVTGNLLGLWTFDDPTIVWNQLKVLDSSVKANNAILSHVPVSVTGKRGQALDFTGAKSDMVTTSNFVNNPQDFTIGAWFKTTSASGRKIIGFENTKTGISTGWGRGIWMGTDGRVRFSVWGDMSGVTSLGALNDGAWHHVVGTHTSAGETVLYIDGILQESLTLAASNYIGYWRVGGHHASTWVGGSDGYFIGTIDDARVYNRALSVSEVSDLYGSGIADDLSVFACVVGCTFSGLLNGQSQNVEIEFMPTAPLGYIGYPLFSSNGGIVGYPAAPYPSVSGTGVLDPMISVSPPVLGFPDTNQGLARRLDITISNIGLGNLSGNISPVKASGLNFYCVIGCNYNIPGGGFANATIEFSPQSVGPLSGTLTLTSNASNGTQLVPVWGNGVLEPILDLRAADTNFGRVVISKFKDKTFTIGNSGTSDLGSGTFVVTGPFTCINPVDVGDGLCHYSIGAGGSAVITIRFSPLAVGRATGSVSLSGVPAARFTVTGIGVSPTITIIEK